MHRFYCSVYYPVDRATDQRTPDESKWALLYHFDVTSTLKYSTQLNGGFLAAEFDVDGNDFLDVSYQKSLLGLSVIITDSFNDRVYEGYVEAVAFQRGVIKITCTGHYKKASYKFFDMIYSVYPWTINYITSPSFEAGSAFLWSAFILVNGIRRYDIGSTFLTTMAGTESLPAKFGDRYLRAQAPTRAAPSDLTMRLSFTVPDPEVSEYMMSMYFRRSGTVVVPYVQITRDSIINDFLLQETITGLVFGEWIRYSFPINTAGATTVQFYISLPNAGTSTTSYLDIDGVMLEPRDITTYYCDGDQYNSSWDGTPHQSVSRRNQEYIKLWQIIKDATELMSEEWNPLFPDYPDADFLFLDWDFTNQKVANSIESLLEGGYDEEAVGPVFFAIWNNSTPYILNPPTDKEYTWYIPAESMPKKPNDSEYASSEIKNKVWSVFSDLSGSAIKTEEASEDQLSQLYYGVREGMLQIQEKNQYYETAVQLRDLALSRNKDAKLTRSVEISGVVRDASSSLHPCYKIRAGDTVLIGSNDYPLAVYENLYGDNIDKTYNFLVKRTEYDASKDTMVLSFDTADLYLASMFARLGIDGGLE